MRADPSTLTFTNPRGFLVVEGVNGAGKGTLIGQLKTHITAQVAHKITITREPGGTPFGVALRELLLGQSGSSRSPLSEAFLFAADRAQHVATVIAPALARKELVISDRYYYSTLAFQGYGRGLDLAMLESINKFAVQGCLPDLVILLDLDPKVGLARTGARGTKERDSFEDEELAFHRRLRAGFLDLAEKVPEPFLVLDAGQPAELVFNQASVATEKWLNSF